MPQYKLLLYPSLPGRSQTGIGVIVAALKNCGLISGQQIHGQYLAGQAFTDVLTFLGCSPNICITPQDDGSHCHIVIKPAQSASHCLGHTASATPRCPQCKKKIPDWQQTGNWQLGETVCVCPHCNTTTAMQNLNWKQECAYGCLAVEIINIHPFEAVPSENLLQVLHAATGIEWNYAYAQSI